MNIRVILADDHPVVIFGLRQILGATRGIFVVAEATNPKALMEQLERVPCDVLVTDFSMPSDGRPDGLVMLKSICSMFPDVRVIVLTVLDNPGLVTSMFRAGAAAVVHKRNDLMRLPEVVTAAYQQRLARLQPEVWGFATERVGEFENPISPRELEVVRLFANGMCMTEIALHLSRSIKTVSTQKSSAMRKLGLTADAELFAYAQKHGLVS
ncbi:LuxR family transcriptional regulator [Pseudomonas sp. ATCC 13867]|uniref:response regulator transcription factor n=1 Tax=Pseudomonas sp. ATCC 13867 TaxID=1294143 RepID=UPI0002C4E8A3|nr:response regulator transcription factor [Pseudomonas sp. ATCC 13867]AGI24574.1 LuxR family transcriptional regulator [Pseudomonas sp. ATCC 13867]